MWKNSDTMINRYLFLLLFLLVCSIGKTLSNDSVRFTIIAPDTVEIGKQIRVVYKLYSNEYKDIEYPKYH